MSKLFVVATPIGNLEDMTPRAVDVMRSVSLLLVEDTRWTIKLLNHFDIKTKMVCYHKFNEKKRSEEMIERMIREKLDIALVTDAGTPCISDPGYEIVKEAHEKGIEVIAVPGASAVITALSISGFDTSNFCFYGFLPREKKEMDQLFEKIKVQDIRTIVLYESPKRIIKSLERIRTYLGDIEVAVFSDLTKLYERIYRGEIQKVAEQMTLNPNVEKGEYVIALRKGQGKKEETVKISIEALIVDSMMQKDLPLKVAYKNVIEQYGYSRNDVYEAMIRLKGLRF